MRHTRPSMRAADLAILHRIASFSENTEPVAFNAAELSDDDLRSEYGRIRTRGGELSARTDLDAKESSELTELSAQLDQVNAELSARTERAAAAQATRDKFATLPELEPVANVPDQIGRAHV